MILQTLLANSGNFPTFDLVQVLEALRKDPQAAGWIVAIIVIFLGFYIVMRILKILEDFGKGLGGRNR